MDGEAGNEAAPEREASDGERAPDEEAFAEVVDADAEGDEEREREGARAALFERAFHGEDDDDREEGCAGEECQSLVGSWERVGEFETFGGGVDREKGEESESEREQRVRPRGRGAMHEGKEAHPGGDGDEAHEETDERVARDGTWRRCRCLERDRDLVLPNEARVGEDRDDVGLALDPRVGDGDGCRVERAKRRVAVDLECPERVVHHDLGDGDGRVGGIPDVKFDDAFAQGDPVERDLLGRRRTVVEPRAGLHDEQGEDQEREQHGRDDNRAP